MDKDNFARLQLVQANLLRRWGERPSGSRDSSTPFVSRASKAVTPLIAQAVPT